MVSFISLSTLLVVQVVAVTALFPYAPKPALCPSTPLVRAATGLSSSEANFIAKRKPVADVGLAAWLQKISTGFGTAKLPTVALTTSGGGYRSLLSGAGVIQALDGRDSNVATSGLFQGLTYHAGLSGGAWLLSSFAGNNYPTISSLAANIWSSAFNTGFLGVAVDEAVPVTAELVEKDAAGFSPTLTDPWGRFLSFQLLSGSEGGVADTLSGVAALSNFTSFNVPFPIMTSIGVQAATECEPMANGTMYELTPFDFGSWSTGVNAFTQTQFLGTSLSNGKPTSLTCTVDYDNLGYVLGTSSNLFNDATCLSALAAELNLTGLVTLLEAVLPHETTVRDTYAVYPNPFFQSAGSPLVSSQTELSLVDGGETDQNNPLFPMLQPSRNVDVVIVNDNSADTADNFPDGSEVFETYQQSLLAGLTKMPVIPSGDVFVAQGLNKHPTFFGCNDPSTITLIYMPNVNYTFPSNEPTSKLQYAPSETSGMIANGVQIAIAGGDTAWPTCLACGIMKKTGEALPAACTACFTQYCFN